MNYKNLEKEWRASQVFFSGRELVSIFSGSGVELRIKELIKGFSTLAEKLSKEIHDDLIAIHELKNDDFSTWFAEKIIEAIKRGLKI